LNRNSLFLPLIILMSCVRAGEPVIIHDAWVAEAPPVVPSRAGYLEIENNSTGPVTLLSVSSPVFDRIEIHRTVTESGISRMQRYRTVEIKPGEKLLFEPGGFHLMLFESDTSPRAGDVVPLVFEFGISLRVDAITREHTDQPGPHRH